MTSLERSTVTSHAPDKRARQSWLNTENCSDKCFRFQLQIRRLRVRVHSNQIRIVVDRKFLNVVAHFLEDGVASKRMVHLQKHNKYIFKLVAPRKYTLRLKKNRPSKN